MGEQLTLTLTAMANGGAALGRDASGRVYFVPLAIPGEKVRLEVTRDKGSYRQARLLEVLEADADRVLPRCPHFGVCGGCQLQHISYERQVALKIDVLRDQLARIGKIQNPPLEPPLVHPTPWAYRYDTALSPVEGGGLGFWSPVERRVIPIETCEIIDPALRDLLHDIDLELPGLRRLSLRLGDDDQRLIAFEVDDVEPPALEVDLPLSATIILPDRTTANLIGDNFVVRAVGAQAFRVSAGCAFPTSPPQTAALVESVLALAGVGAGDAVLELYSGVGLLTSFLSAAAKSVSGIEPNSDALADAVVNLEETENVSLYEGEPTQLLPALAEKGDVVVASPPAGLSQSLIRAIRDRCRRTLIYVSADVAVLARDARALQQNGFRLRTIQPIDMEPQTFQLWTVSAWDVA